MKTYLETVQEILASIPRGIGKIAAYNTGHGISICPQLNKDIGYVDILDVVLTRVAKVKVPTFVATNNTWDIEWNQANELINQFIAKYNQEAK